MKKKLDKQIQQTIIQGSYKIIRSMKEKKLLQKLMLLIK